MRMASPERYCWSSWELHGQMGRPLCLGIHEHIGNPRQARLDHGDVFLEQLSRDLCFYAKRELFALSFCLHGFGCELSDIGDVRNVGGNDILRRSIKHDARLVANLDSPCQVRRQKESHMDVA